MQVGSAVPVVEGVRPGRVALGSQSADSVVMGREGAPAHHRAVWESEPSPLSGPKSQVQAGGSMSSGHAGPGQPDALDIGERSMAPAGAPRTPRS